MTRAGLRDDRTHLCVWAGGEAPDQYMELRSRYVTAMGWLDDRVTDQDRYDTDGQTWYLIRRAECPDTEIAAALRVTKVPSIYESLTWSMLGADPGRQADIIAGNLARMSELNQAAASPADGLWDLTRLVAPVDGSVPTTEIVRSIYEVLGMAMRKTVLESGTDPFWMFLTTPTIKRMLETAGIPCAVLFAGRVSRDDQDDAFLCIARPKRAWDRIGHSRTRAHQRAFGHIRAGAQKMAAAAVQ